MGPPPPVKVVRRTPTPASSRLSTPAAPVATDADAAGDGVGEKAAEDDAADVEAAEVPALDAAFFANLEAFMSPEGGFCGSSAPLATFLAEALAARC